MTKIVTRKLNTLKGIPWGAVALFKREFNYVTVNQNTGIPVSRHVRWEKARDKVLRQAPHQRLIIVDCTGT
jgi:hypothetical protein